MNPGTQIAYIPTHANNDIHHPDVEFGFVTSKSGDDHFCRFWVKSKPGTLRTRANSERTPTVYLKPFMSVPQSTVDQLMIDIINGIV